MTPPGQPPDPQSQARLAARAALEKQAEEVLILDLRGVSTIADYFVLCTADNPRQLGALRDHLEAVLRKAGAPLWHVEGSPASTSSSTPDGPPQWILMDCGALVIHLFDRPARAFYRLEQFWADTPRVPMDAA